MDRLGRRQRPHPGTPQGTASATPSTASIPTGTEPSDLEQAIADADKARAERLIADAFVAYASDVSTGRVRANTVDKDIDIQQR